MATELIYRQILSEMPCEPEILKKGEAVVKSNDAAGKSPSPIHYPPAADKGKVLYIGAITSN